MDNKLSELSKPVATVDVQRGRPDGNMFGVAWSSAGHAIPDGPHFLYSQEYVYALTQRIAELESANKSQDDHINQQQDRIDSLEKTNAGLGRRLGDAEKRLATPVRLPRPACTYADHSYPAYSRKQVEVIITSAGMRFTVEGDE